MDTTHPDSASPAPRSPPDPLHDVRALGDYRILRLLGEGGMGSVYLGYHEGQKQQVAIKVLAENLAINQAYVDRFYREARSGLLLSHPNIVRPMAVGQDRATNRYYLVLEYVDGPSAHALLDRYGKLSVGDAVHIARDIARALEHAHSRNIVHRDIKPDNILITRSGVAKLSDLGLAKRIDETSHLTAARQGFGTTYYMPYEQAINAKTVDGRSDIYALGATLYHLVTGVVPFAGENHLEVVEKKDQGEFAPAGSLNPAVPRTLDRILAKMLARHPRDRYQTASELIVDLDRSGLGVAVPSFADPDLARQDPWVQACLTANVQPTRPDLESPVQQELRANGKPGVWYLRYCDRKGRRRVVRATTAEIVQCLRDDRLPAKAELSALASGAYQSPSQYPDFKDIKPDRARRRRPARLRRKPAAVPSPKEDGAARPAAAGALPGWHRRRLLLVAVGIGVGLLVAGVTYYLRIAILK